MPRAAAGHGHPVGAAGGLPVGVDQVALGGGRLLEEVAASFEVGCLAVAVRVGGDGGHVRVVRAVDVEGRALEGVAGVAVGDLGVAGRFLHLEVALGLHLELVGGEARLGIDLGSEEREHDVVVALGEHAGEGRAGAGRAVAVAGRVDVRAVKAELLVPAVRGPQAPAVGEVDGMALVARHRAVDHGDLQHAGVDVVVASAVGLAGEVVVEVLVAVDVAASHPIRRVVVVPIEGAASVGLLVGDAHVAAQVGVEPGFAVVHGVGRVPEFLPDGDRVQIHVVELHLRQRRHGVGGVVGCVGLLRREERSYARALDGHLERRGRRGGGGHGQNAGGLVVARRLGEAVRLLGVVHVAVVGGHLDVVDRDGGGGLRGRDADRDGRVERVGLDRLHLLGDGHGAVEVVDGHLDGRRLALLEGGRLEELDLQSLRRDVVVAVERLRDVDEARLGVVLDALDAHAEVVHDGGLEVDRARGGPVLGGRVGERDVVVRVPVDLVELLDRRVHCDDLLAAFLGVGHDRRDRVALFEVLGVGVLHGEVLAGAVELLAAPEQEAGLFLADLAGIGLRLHVALDVDRRGGRVVRVRGPRRRERRRGPKPGHEGEREQQSHRL